MAQPEIIKSNFPLPPEQIASVVISRDLQHMKIVTKDQRPYHFEVVKGKGYRDQNNGTIFESLHPSLPAGAIFVSTQTLPFKRKRRNRVPRRAREALEGGKPKPAPKPPKPGRLERLRRKRRGRK